MVAVNTCNGSLSNQVWAELTAKQRSAKPPMANLYAYPENTLREIVNCHPELSEGSKMLHFVQHDIKQLNDIKFPVFSYSDGAV